MARPLPRSGVSLFGPYPAAYDLDGPPDGPAFRTHRGVLVRADWSDDRADAFIDEMRQDQACGAYDEAPF